MQINGTVVKGMGEGAYFMSMPHYKDEIKRALHFEAFPGTLNVKTSDKWIGKLTNPIKINGYEKDGKVFGGANCYRASIGEIKGAIIIPDLTKHKEDVAEFIAPVHVKSTLKINDGSKVTIKLK